MIKKAVFVCGCIVSMVGAVFAQNPTIRIMPLGDSITYGASTPGGYRYPLYVALTNAGYNVDFVGTQNNNAATGLHDPDHQGHGGWKISSASNGLYENILGWFSAISDPHVVLLHIGTNDTGDGPTTFATAIDRWDLLIERIAKYHPSAHIIATTLMKRGTPQYTYITNSFNPYVPSRIAAHQAAGRRVYFLDMHSKLELSDMYDNLHPSATGYQKMADAWFSAITNVIASTTLQINQPTLASATPATNNTTLSVLFSKKVQPDSATNTANYTISGGISILSAAIDAGQRTVTLTTTQRTKGVLYTLSATNVYEETGAVAIPAASQTTFYGITPRGYAYNVPESGAYQLVYSLDLPSAQPYYKDNMVPYSIDNSAKLPPFKRVAYYLELQRSDGDLQYAWVSMDAFTKDAKKIGVPARYTGAIFQQVVSNMNVVCNVGSVSNGTFATGNIEFWPDNYNNVGGLGTLGGNTNTLYDFDDARTTGNYGCMQVHNFLKQQTVLAFNCWGGNDASAPNIGIGNSTENSQSTDWTFVYNAGLYTVKTLQVLVQLDSHVADTTAPKLLSAKSMLSGRMVEVYFDKAMTPATAIDTYTFNNGVQVISSSTTDDGKTVQLVTTQIPDGAALVLTVKKARDVAGNSVSGVLDVTSIALPSQIAANVGALATGFQLVYGLDIPALGNFNSSSCYRYNNSSLPGSFDRVAYYMELVKANFTTQYMWVAFDPLTQDKTKIGIPTVSSGAIWQQVLTNMDVFSNVSGITNYTACSYGNIEFWPYDYGNSNALAIAGASHTLFDFGDERRSNGNYGSMQLHNYRDKTTLMAVNNWGGDGRKLCVGIGNSPSSLRADAADWTFAENSATYYSRKLFVLIRPVAVSTNDAIPAQVVANVPDAINYEHAYTVDIPVRANFSNGASNLLYHTVNRAALVSKNIGRVAYYLELQKASDPQPQYLWVSMDAFESDVRKLSVPTNTCAYQRRVTRMDVKSNVAGITNGTGLSTGFIEFWPNSYTASNVLGIASASHTAYDFGDKISDSFGTSTGYGSMQVHNVGSLQTLFAINNFNNTSASEAVCIGIGNRPGTVDTDWTFAKNAGDYTVRRLYVFVRSLDQVCLTFSKAMGDGALNSALYTINKGITVTRARLSANCQDVYLTVTPALTPGQTYQIDCNPLLLVDRTPNANAVYPYRTWTTCTVPAVAWPAVLTGISDAAGYTLVNTLPLSDPTYTRHQGAPYLIDEGKFYNTAFDRQAYCLELVGTNGVSQWAYVSMNAFGKSLDKIGLPTAERRFGYQQYVSNLVIAAYSSATNNPPIAVGSVAAGNVEFWPANYSQANAKGIPNANDTYFDCGDMWDGSFSAGHGTMQIHNFAIGQTILSLNNIAGSSLGLGIGNREDGAAQTDRDWTHAGNRAAYPTRNLYVLARLTGSDLVNTTNMTIWTQPRSISVNEGQSAVFSVLAPDAALYQWRKNGVDIPGATLSVFEIARSVASDQGAYSVVLYTASGDYTVSEAAQLTVLSRDVSYTQTNAVVRIMPLGDSITYGASTAGGYRLPLYQMLTNAGYRVDYVGTRTDNGATGLPDSNHQGLSGWRISIAGTGLLENMRDWFASIDDPHIVLLHIGTNDTDDTNRFARTSIANLDTLITRIADCQPSAHIIVTSLMRRTGSQYDAITNYFNPNVPSRVAAHQLAGRRVYFLDMHSYLQLSDMYDNLHPTASGYTKMATAWFSAITNIFPANVQQLNLPAMVRAVPSNTLTSVALTFNKPVTSASAAAAGNYQLDNGGRVTAASLASDLRTVTLTTTPLSLHTRYTLTVNNIVDTNTVSPLTILPDSTIAFMPTLARGYTSNVPESVEYQLLYTLNIPNTGNYSANQVDYAVDNSAMKFPISRIAYYLELQRVEENSPLYYTWVSMDAFTNDIRNLGVPTRFRQAVIQKALSNLRVYSNVDGVKTGPIATGQIEFWPYNYTAANGAAVAGADGGRCDFGDTCSWSGDHGSMQIHNVTDRQTLFAFNNWGASGSAFLTLGMGNQPSSLGAEPDWTFNYNGGYYAVKTIQVLAKMDTSDGVPPMIEDLRVSTETLELVFNETIAPDSVTPTSFAFTGGIVLKSYSVLPDGRTVRLLMSRMPADQQTSVTIANIRDVSGNKMVSDTRTLTPTGVPASIASRVGSLANGYELVYLSDIPIRGNANSTNAYQVDFSSRQGSFDRVAYYMELVGANGTTTQYVWVAFDPLTQDKKKIGFPTTASGAIWQQKLTNMDVVANVSGITNYTACAYGNIEFWPTDYVQNNALVIDNANSSYFDFGDERKTTGTHGSMQIHNFRDMVTLFAINNWGSDGNTLGIGIGNRSGTNDKDWTNASNSGSYGRRLLYVFVRPATRPNSNAPATVVANVPDAANYFHLYTVNIPARNAMFSSAVSNAAYHVVNNFNTAPRNIGRIAYYLELVDSNDSTQYVWTAMDAFETNLAKLSIPTNTCYYQRTVNNLDVKSNVGSVTQGTGLQTGYIEFCPSDYSAANANKIPGASESAYDFGDTLNSATTTGHGCMQVHNWSLGKTLFGIGNFNNVATLDIGIGDGAASGVAPDWTLTGRAGNYKSRTLYVFVQEGAVSDVTAPYLVTAVASRSGNQVCATFSETLAEQATNVSYYALNSNVTVTAAQLAPNQRDVMLTLSPALAAGGSYTLTVRPLVADRSTSLNPCAGRTFTITVASNAVPAVLANIAETASYTLVNQLSLANSTYSRHLGAPYSIDEGKFYNKAFDRLAYCLELVGTNGVTQWSFVSMDAFTEDLTKVGLPTADRKAGFQQYVTNVSIQAYSSATAPTPPIQTGVVARANIEFWPANYSAGNAKGIPGASDSTYDFGDYWDGSVVAGHGCMQIHNYAAQQTILSISQFTQGSTGIGFGTCNNTGNASDKDWTFLSNQSAYTVKNLYVLARITGDVPMRSTANLRMWKQPASQEVSEFSAVTFTAYSPDATSYQWFKNGVLIPGATQASYEIRRARVTDEGDYAVVAYKSISETTVSTVATLSVRQRGLLFILN